MLTYDQARTICQSRIADSSDDTAVEQALDQAQREVCRARRWPELIKRAFFNTEAAYETGTVAVAASGTTWTLTGGTYPTNAATYKWRIALGVSSPWYEVTARGSDTAVTTAAYQSTAETAADFIIYRSHYRLAADVDRVEEMWIHGSNSVVPLLYAPTDQAATEFMHYPSGPGIPTHYYPYERDSTGRHQMLLGPATPDDEYRVEYTYRKKATDGQFDGNLDETRWPLIVSRALSILYEDEFPNRSLMEYQKYDRLLKKEWNEESETETQEIRMGDARYRYPGSDSYLRNLPGFGKTDYPST